MSDFVRGLCSFDVVLGTLYFGVGALDGGGGAVQVVGHFRHFENRKNAAFAHMVAYINVNATDEPGDFRHDIDFLIGREFGGEGQRVGEIRDGRRLHSDDGERGAGVLLSFGRAAA